MSEEDQNRLTFNEPPLPIELPHSWIKLEGILQDKSVFYDWKNNLFSLSPVLTPVQFVTMINRIPDRPSFNFESLDEKLVEVHS